MSLSKDLIRLKHMLDYSREAVDLVQGKTRESLDSDRLLGLGLVRLMEIIGEAANRVSPEFQALHSTVPWSQIISLRNRLIHGYDSVDMEILWAILTHDLPDLISELENILYTGSCFEK